MSTKPEWRGWSGFLGRAIGAYTESEGGDSEETNRARARLFDAYGQWVDAGRPDHDPEPLSPPPTPGDAGVREAPPTAGEVLAHVQAGGAVERWSLIDQEWFSPWVPAGPGHVMNRVDPSTPQPGLRLVRDRAAAPGEER